MKRCIIIQGPVNSSRLTDDLGWEENKVIHSTWKGSEQFYKEGETVVFSDTPSAPGISNWLYQKQSTLAGLYLAKEMGFERAVKWRSDFRVKNPSSFLNLFEDGKINFYAWHDHAGGYLIDYFIEGSVEDLINIFENSGDSYFPEKNLTDSVFSLNLAGKVCFVLPKMGNGAETDTFWIKNGFWLSVNNSNETKHHYLNKIP